MSPRWPNAGPSQHLDEEWKATSKDFLYVFGLDVQIELTENTKKMARGADHWDPAFIWGIGEMKRLLAGGDTMDAGNEEYEATIHGQEIYDNMLIRLPHTNTITH